MNASPATLDRAIKRTEGRIRLLNMTPLDKRNNPLITITRENNLLARLKALRGLN